MIVESDSPFSYLLLLLIHFLINREHLQPSVDWEDYLIKIFQAVHFKKRKDSERIKKDMKKRWETDNL